MKRIAGMIAWLLCSWIYPLYSETEPNNDAAHANLLIQMDTGTLSGNDVYDWFYFDLPQAGIWKLTITKTGGGNVWIYLLDGQKPTQDEIANYYASYWDINGEVWNNPLLAGRYYLQIKKGDYTVHYQLSASLQAPDWPSDAEPNDTKDAAIEIPVNSSVSGTIHYYGAGYGIDQFDWYKVYVPQGGYLVITDFKRGPGNGWIYLLDGDDPALPEVANTYFQYFESPPEGWQLYFPALSGHYYLKVGNGGDVVNYKIKVDLILPPFPEDAEPNDSQILAKPFPMNDSVSGLLGYYKTTIGFDGADWYKLEVPEQGFLDLKVIKKGFSNANVRLRTPTADIGGVYLGFGDWTTSFGQLVPKGTYYLFLENLDLYLQYKVVLQYTRAPQAGFAFRQSGNSVAFENTSLRGETFAWAFDDGAASATANAYHEYAQPGNYDVCLIASNAGGKDTACQKIVVPGLARVYPDKAGNTGDATLRVFGGGLDTAYRVRLVRGGSTLAQSSYTGFEGKSGILCVLDLRGIPTGVCDLVVEKPGGPSYTLPGGFTILTGTSPDPWISVTGRDRILFNTWTTFTVNYGNHGNVDARLVPVWFVFSRDTGLQVEFPNVFFYNPDAATAELPTEGLYTELDSVFGKPFPARAYPLLIPIIPAGTVQSFQIRIKTSGNFKLLAWTEKPWYQSPLNDNKLACMSEALSEAPPDLNLDEDRVLCTQVFTALFYDRILDDYFTDSWNDPTLAQPEFFSSVLKCLRAAVKICGVSSAADREKISAWMTNWIMNRALQNRNIQAKGGDSCPLEFEPQNPQSKPMTAVSSLDPNEKTGLNGYGALHYSAPREDLPYVIHFENTASATAPAHTVVVTDELDKTKFDLSTFQFGDIRLGLRRIPVEAGAQTVVKDLALDDRHLTVRMLASLDQATGNVTWTFRSLDSLTLLDIEDPDQGFLPPNLDAPEGEGSVSFSVRLITPPAHGDIVLNNASIVFDANAPIPTNPHFLTFDRLAPESAVQALPPAVQDHPFEVRWSGTDKGSGLSYYNVYVSTDGGPDTLWVGGTTETAAIFTGQVGHVYRFYSAATDHVGNVEAKPLEPDATTTITVGTQDAAEANKAISLYPNPAHTRVLVHYTGTGPGLLTLADHAGRMVRQMPLSGAQLLELATAGMPSGLYVWTWMPDDPGPALRGKLMILHP